MEKPFGYTNHEVEAQKKRPKIMERDSEGKKVGG
jgi:hypothetical protein